MWPFALSSALKTEFERLEHDFKMLRLEWEETLEKLTKLYRRTNRNRAILEAAEVEGDGEAQGAPVPQEGQGPHRLLSPHQLKAQQEILRRRAGG